MIKKRPVEDARKEGECLRPGKRSPFCGDGRGHLPPFAMLFIVSMLLMSACAQSASTGPVGKVSPLLSHSTIQRGEMALRAFTQWIALLQRNGGDVTGYQQHYLQVRQALQHAKTGHQYTAVLQTLDTDTQAIKLPALKQEVRFLQEQLQQQVSTWGQHHQFSDRSNGQTYAQDYEYDNQHGIGGALWLQENLAAEKTLTDYQNTVEKLSIWLYNFQQMRANTDDRAPYNHPHQADQDLLQHYGAERERVVVVSLGEQALRAYENGVLVNAFLVTTGQPSLPTPPGVWTIASKLHPTIFRSGASPGSPDWYPDTPITYAMQYHNNGYFLHDAWWRTQFGPGTNYPHQDPDGDPFASQGSHGCINMSTADAAWLYDFVSMGTRVIMY